MLVAVCIGLFIFGPKYRRFFRPPQAAMRRKLVLWGGLSAAGLLVVFIALFTGGDMMLPLASIGLAVFLIGTLQRYRTARGRVSQLGEGPLLHRIRELASRA